MSQPALMMMNHCGLSHLAFALDQPLIGLRGSAGTKFLISAQTHHCVERRLISACASSGHHQAGAKCSHRRLQPRRPTLALTERSERKSGLVPVAWSVMALRRCGSEGRIRLLAVATPRWTATLRPGCMLPVCHEPRQGRDRGGQGYRI